MPNPPAPLTLARLMELEACEPALALFKSTFGDSVDMANPTDGYETLDFDWDWAARKLWEQPARAERDSGITGAAWANYCKIRAAARADFDKIIAPARAERDKTIAAASANYYDIIAPARANFDKTLAAAWLDYDKTLAAARANYRKTIAPAWADYNKIIAAAFVGGYVGTFYRQQRSN